MKKYRSTIEYDYSYCGTENEEVVELEFEDDATPDEIQKAFDNWAWETAIQNVNACGGEPEPFEEEELEDGERPECFDCEKHDCDDCDNR